MPGRKSGFSCRSLIAATTSSSRAHRTTFEPARRATRASAVPQAPPPMIASRFTRPTSFVSPRNPRSRRPRGAGVERPARARRRVETVDKAKAKPLDPRPGDHRPVVGAQRRRRRDKTQPLRSPREPQGAVAVGHWLRHRPPRLRRSPPDGGSETRRPHSRSGRPARRKSRVRPRRQDRLGRGGSGGRVRRRSDAPPSSVRRTRSRNPVCP